MHFDIQKGEYVAIAGPSGCGKTTLLSILGLLDAPSGGEYQIAGTSVAHLGAADRARVRNKEIGFIFQAFNLIGDLTVWENVELPLTYREMDAAERKDRVQKALERVGMTHRAKHFPSQLSGGQQQRIAVARAVAGDPAILLADEPTGNLDSRNGEAVMELLRELHAAGRRCAWSRTTRGMRSMRSVRCSSSTDGSSRRTHHSRCRHWREERGVRPARLPPAGRVDCIPTLYSFCTLEIRAYRAIIPVHERH